MLDLTINRAVLTIWFALMAASGVSAADLRPQTVAAFDLYVAETERQREQSLTNAAFFLWIDMLPAADQAVRRQQLHAGTFVIERLTTIRNEKKIDVPDGIIHHWLGAVFVPGVSL